MKKQKNVKVTFHTILKKPWKKKSDDEIPAEEPFYEVAEVLDYVKKLSRTSKFYDLQGNKFCYLEFISKEVINNSLVIYTGIFKSARNEFRPDLINKKTGIERKNPKKITEGDIEKTHFLIKIDRIVKEVYVFLERNFYGINIQNLVNYISDFCSKYLKSKKLTKRFSLLHLEILKNNFLTELKILTRTSLAEVYFDKQLLGSQALNFSNKTVSLKQDLILTAKASTKDSITEVAIDLYNKLQQKNSPISRVRIRGIDPNNNEILLDTALLCKAEFVTVDLNPESGEVNSIQLFSGLKEIANSY